MLPSITTSSSLFWFGAIAATAVPEQAAALAAVRARWAATAVLPQTSAPSATTATTLARRLAGSVDVTFNIDNTSS
jgi:hypothetical protein